MDDWRGGIGGVRDELGGRDESRGKRSVPKESSIVEWFSRGDGSESGQRDGNKRSYYGKRALLTTLHNACVELK